jgi:carboxyl-terminal processing protease
MDPVTQTPQTRIAPIHVAFMISLGALLLVAGFAGGVLIQRDFLSQTATNEPLVVSSLPVDTGGTSAAGQFQRFAEVIRLVDEQYYDLPTDEAELADFWTSLEEQAIRGMTRGLDGYSAYLPKVEQQRAAEQLEGAYEGIGVWIVLTDGEMKIISPIPGSPAEAEGILAGDVILAVDGQPVTAMSAEDALALVRGPEGSTVEITVKRSEQEEPLRFVVERRKIPLPAVIYDYYEDSGVAVAQITIFGDRTTQELDQAIQRARDDGAIGMVVDLRNNGGGWVESAREAIGRFVPADRGPALYEDFDPAVEGDERTESIINGDGGVYELPVVVLVNNGTASSAEIVAGALQDYERAVIVGQQTFGKGSVQRVYPFDDGSTFRLTFAHWFTPEGSRIDGQGIVPDVVLETPDEDAENDIMLETAIRAVVEQGAGTE